MPGTATATFLFSDIEGSTRLEGLVGTTRYGELRERHRAILRAAFRAAPAVEEQGTEGDSFFVDLRAAPGMPSLRRSPDSERSPTEPWPDDGVVRVRMGLHTGEAESAGGSLVGLDINRAARIAALAHGGQIVVSAATRALVGDGLPDGATWLDLGDHRLRDLDSVERLWQVNVEGLPDGFPPLRSGTARRSATCPRA